MIYADDIFLYIRIYADDTSLFLVAHGSNLFSDVLSSVLSLIKLWAYQWKTSFNPEPSKHAVQLVCSRKEVHLDHPEIYFKSIQVSSVEEHKHLGLTQDKKLSSSLSHKGASG